MANSATVARGDEGELHAAVAGYVEAFNKQDLVVVTKMWMENASHVDRESGERTEGREAILADVAESFKSRPELRLTAHVDHVRLIRPDVACVEGQTCVVAPDEDPAVSNFLAILVKQDGAWRIDSIEEHPVAEANSHKSLGQLDWLVGRWVDDSDEVRVDTNIRWTSDGTFLLRSFSVQTADGVAHRGTQVIGWDPRAQEIRSWSFNSDGSFGSGTWSRNGEDWLIKSTQTLADGQAASGTFVLTRVDNDTISLQLIGHEIEGEPQPSKPGHMFRRVAETDDATAQEPDQPADAKPTEPKPTEPTKAAPQN